MDDNRKLLKKLSTSKRFDKYENHTVHISQQFKLKIIFITIQTTKRVVRSNNTLEIMIRLNGEHNCLLST